MKYVEDGVYDNYALDPHLACKCDRCGYRWCQEPIDSKGGKAPQATKKGER